MQVISVLNQKGGSGKTTIATHLARALQLRGHKVALIDTDTQGSASDWANSSEECPVSVVSITRPTLIRDIEQFSRNEFVIIDGAPRANEMARNILKVSDFVLIPAQPSPYDVWATDEFLSLVKERIDMTDGALKAAFVLSRVIKGTLIAQETNDAMLGYGLPVLKQAIYQASIYVKTAKGGKTACDVEPKKEPACNIQALIDEILQMMQCGNVANAL